MDIVEIEAVEDRTRAEGGYARILMRGVPELPPTGRFKLAPVDTEGMGASARSLDDTIFTPLAVTQSDDGLALSVGPDVTEHPALVPGTAFTLDMVEIEAYGVFLWPAITPRARPKRRNIMTRRIASDPLPARVAPTECELPTSDVKTATPPPPVVEHQSNVSAPADEPKPEQGGDRPSPKRVIVKAAAQSPAQADKASAIVELPAKPLAQEPRDNTTPPAKDNGTEAAIAVVTPAAAVATETSPVAKPQQQKQHSSAPLGSRAAKEAEPAKINAELVKPEPPRTAARSAPTAADRTTLDVVAQPEATAPITISQMPAGHSERLPSMASAVAIAAAVLLSAQFVALKVLDLSVVKRSPASSSAIMAAAASPIAPKQAPIATPPPAAQPPAPMRSIYDVIVAGPRSPRGISAEGISPGKAIQTAHTLLHGPAEQRDAEEAIYWLKRYLAATAGAENSRIALTQLGSAYAEPSRGERDFASARLAWELASALGDPVAMCFLGAMHEHGLGVEMSQRSASVWYERATASGRRCATSAGNSASR